MSYRRKKITFFLFSHYCQRDCSTLFVQNQTVPIGHLSDGQRSRVVFLVCDVVLSCINDVLVSIIKFLNIFFVNARCVRVRCLCWKDRIFYCWTNRQITWWEISHSRDRRTWRLFQYSFIDNRTLNVSTRSLKRSTNTRAGTLQSTNYADAKLSSFMIVIRCCHVAQSGARVTWLSSHYASGERNLALRH